MRCQTVSESACVCQAHGVAKVWNDRVAMRAADCVMGEDDLLVRPSGRNGMEYSVAGHLRTACSRLQVFFARACLHVCVHQVYVCV